MDLASVPFGLALIIAFVAGVVSFISPCVLPLVPAYVSYMGGRVSHTVASQVNVKVGHHGEASISPSLGTRFSTFAHGIAFVAGFTFVFVAFGLLATAFFGLIGGSLNTIIDILGRVGGVIIIFFGLHFMGVVPSIIERLRARKAILGSVLTTTIVAIVGGALILWGFVEMIIALPVLAVFLLWLVLGGAYTNPGAFWLKTLNTIETALYTDTRREMSAAGKEGLLGSAFMGVVFSAGWTPCVGPVYGAALNLAVSGTGGDIAQAGILLTVYSLGLGIPFLVTTLLLDSAQGLLRRLQRQMGRIEVISGALLILIGIIVATGQLQNLSQNFASGELAELSVNLEESVVNIFTGENEENGEPLETVPTENAPEGESAAPSNLTTLDGVGSIDTLAASSAPAVGTAVGDRAPDFTTTTDTGETTKLSDYRGQIVLLNFWATWCGPCRREMPEFERAFQEHGGDGFTILAINNQETLDDVAGYREEFSLSFPLLMDENGAIQDQYNIRTYPSTFILNREGVIIAQHFGPLTEAAIQELINEALS